MITIICLGRIKEAYITEGIKEYTKRLSPFTKWEIIELKEATNKELTANLKSEAQAILNKITKDDYVITLEITGQKLDSIAFADLLKNKLNHLPRITFVIGSSCGLDQSVKNRSNLALSFSPMTFPHQLFRLVLVEQIYRCFCIINNKEYHK